MKLTCEQVDLLSAVALAIRAVPTRTTMPIFEGILIVAQGNSLTLTGSDSNFGIETSIPADVEVPGSVVVPGKLFAEIIRKSPPGVMHIQVDERFQARTQCQDSRTTLQGNAPDEYPPLPLVVESHTLTLSKIKLKDMIRQVAFAISTDDARQVLTGALFEVSPGTLKLVALDGFRLALRQSGAETDAEFEAIVPGRPLVELSRILDDDETPITLSFSSSHMNVRMGETVITMRLLEGEYIRYSRILPTDHKLSVRVDRRALDDAVDRAALLSREGKNNLVRLSLSGGRMVIQSNNEIGNVREELQIEADGEDLDIAFNTRFISDMVKAIDTDDLMLFFSTALTPCIARPAQGSDYLYLLLPVRTAGA